MKLYKSLKKIFSIAFIALQCHILSGQKLFNAGIDIGATSSQISGDGFYGFGQFGLTGSAFTTIRWDDHWKTTLQIGWNAKGARKYLSTNNNVAYRLRANYIDIPIWMEYRYKSWQFFAGPSFNVHVNHKELINNVDAFPERNFKPLELALSGGISYSINDHWMVRGIFANSIAPVRDHLNPNSYPNPKLVLGNFHRSILNKGQYFTSISIKITYFFNPI